MNASPVPLIDTHVHFWDLTHPRLTYSWLEPEAVHSILGNIDGIKSLRFEADHLYAETRFAQVEATVHVQAADGSADPVEETRWLTEMARVGRGPEAIVAHADLASADIEQVLAGHLESPLLRGIRDFAIEGFLAEPASSPDLERGVALLGEHDLVCDLDCEWMNMPAARGLAERHPDVTFVLEHVGYPRSRDDEYLRAWRSGISELAHAANVVCKISGLGMCDPLWTLDSIRPWVLHCIEAFTPARCVFGTNWPVDRLYSSYDAIVTAYRTTISGFSEDEQQAMFHGNARQVYRLD